MKKKYLVLLMVTTLGNLCFAQKDNVAIDKEVTGVNREVIEYRVIHGENIKVNEEKIDAKKLNLSNEILKKQSNETLIREDEELKRELSKDVEKDSSIMKKILGILAIVAIAVAL